MKCKKRIENFMELDRGEAIPLTLRLHILFCKECRDEIFSLRKAFDSVTGKTPYKIPRDMSDLVMKRIEFIEIEYAHNVSNVKWLSGGIMIFAGLVLISFSEWAGWLGSYMHGYFEGPLYIVMGLGLTVYCSLFVGTHLEYLKKLNERFGETVRHGRI